MMEDFDSPSFTKSYSIALENLKNIAYTCFMVLFLTIWVLLKTNNVSTSQHKPSCAFHQAPMITAMQKMRKESGIRSFQPLLTEYTST